VAARQAPCDAHKAPKRSPPQQSRVKVLLGSYGLALGRLACRTGLGRHGGEDAHHGAGLAGDGGPHSERLHNIVAAGVAGFGRRQP
jgi:hypothetical protein